MKYIVSNVCISCATGSLPNKISIIYSIQRTVSSPRKSDIGLYRWIFFFWKDCMIVHLEETCYRTMWTTQKYQHSCNFQSRWYLFQWVQNNSEYIYCWRSHFQIFSEQFLFLGLTAISNLLQIEPLSDFGSKLSAFLYISQWITEMCFIQSWLNYAIN
jgi:hypothetical protein